MVLNILDIPYLHSYLKIGLCLFQEQHIWPICLDENWNQASWRELIKIYFMLCQLFIMYISRSRQTDEWYLVYFEIKNEKVETPYFYLGSSWRRKT